jgi:hypothetical protein
MSTGLAADVQAGVVPPEDIHASFFTLITATLGLFVTAVGLVWMWQVPTASPVLPLWLEIVGPVLIAVAVTSHIDHLANRIGHFAVISTIVGVFLWGAAYLPFAINNLNYGSTTWQRFFYSSWGTAFLLFSLTLFVVAWHKEDRLEHQDLAKEHIIHVSFPVLIIAAIGTLLFSCGLFDLAFNPTGSSQMTWVLEAVGPLLLAVAVTLHIDHMSKHIGRFAVVLGIIGMFVWALPNIPLAFKPSLVRDNDWGPFLTNGCFGIGYALLGLTALLLVLRKSKLEKSGAVMSW